MMIIWPKRIKYFFSFLLDFFFGGGGRGRGGEKGEGGGGIRVKVFIVLSLSPLLSQTLYDVMNRDLSGG